MIMEGLAECFREKVMGGKPAPWSISLKEENVMEHLIEIESLLNSRSQLIYKQVFFGSKKFSKWMGYSIGYWIVKKFIDKNKIFSWQKLMQIEASDFLDFYKSNKERA
jgi:uncharacterized protein YjaZ